MMPTASILRREGYSRRTFELSDREKEVLRFWMMPGENYKTVAERLQIAPCTVRSHIVNCYDKLCVNSKRELAEKLALIPQLDQFKTEAA